MGGFGSERELSTTSWRFSIVFKSGRVGAMFAIGWFASRNVTVEAGLKTK